MHFMSLNDLPLPSVPGPPPTSLFRRLTCGSRPLLGPLLLSSYHLVCPVPELSLAFLLPPFSLLLSLTVPSSHPSRYPLPSRSRPESYPRPRTSPWFNLSGRTSTVPLGSVSCNRRLVKNEAQFPGERRSPTHAREPVSRA